MSTLNFKGAALGEVPQIATTDAVVVMGKHLGTAAVNDVAANIGTATAEGTARPVNWLTATVRAQPGGGLAPRGDETAKYVYRGGEMFGVVENPAPGLKAR